MSEERITVPDSLYELCRQLIAGEFSQFENDPIGYAESMNWDWKKFAGIDLPTVAKEIAWSARDVRTLAIRVMILDQEKELDYDDTLSVAEHDKVSDYIFNLVVKKIVERLEAVKN
jgi:hypothetical protein